MKLSWIRTDPKSCKDACPYKRQKRRHTEIEVKATGRWWQRLEGSHKEHQGLPALPRSQERAGMDPLSELPQGANSADTFVTDFLAPGPVRE